jgi:hypothetical protein
MEEVLAVLLALTFAYLVNRWGIERFGLAEVVWLGPVVEEFGKTVFAWLVGAVIWPVHIGFGAFEAFWDIRTGGTHRHAAALASIIGHTVFGGLTAWGLKQFASLWGGILIGMTAHILWNSYVILFVVKRRRE